MTVHMTAVRTETTTVDNAYLVVCAVRAALQLTLLLR
jgi:hypothetical protein